MMVTEQRRGRKIAMTPEELNAFLSEQRTCRVATVRSDGSPHVAPLWFAWDGEAVWLYSIVSSQRWTDIQRQATISLVVDDGETFDQLRGVEVVGTAAVTGEVPRAGEPEPALEAPEKMFADKYAGGRFMYDGRHAWLRVKPEKIVSWDFRKAGR